jgi:Arc/MetJ family transcription regulator
MVHHMMPSVMHNWWMRTTVTLDDSLLARAAEAAGTTERAALIRMGLEALVERETARRLALLGGSDPDAEAAPRSRRAG